MRNTKEQLAWEIKVLRRALQKATMNTAVAEAYISQAGMDLLREGIAQMSGTCLMHQGRHQQNKHCSGWIPVTT